MTDDEKQRETRAALDQLYADAIAIYETARLEVTIEKKDGTIQHYAATRFREQIERGRSEGALVPTIAKVVRKTTTGFGHLERAGRHDLMLETLVLDTAKPYHQLFSRETISIARARMAALGTAPAPAAPSPAPGPRAADPETAAAVYAIPARRVAFGSAAPEFDAYIAVDWSSSSVPKTGSDSIWVAAARPPQ